MPGINKTGKPDTKNIFLGRGRILAASLDATTQKPAHFRHLGNVTAFGLTVESEKLEHQNSRSGVKSIDREIVLSQKVQVSITLDEALDFDNLAYFFSGTAEKASASANNAANDSNHTDVLLHSDAVTGRWYELRTAAGKRLYDLASTGAVTIKSGAGPGVGSALVLGTDYELDLKWGMVFLRSASEPSNPGTHVDGNSIWFSYTTAGNAERDTDQVTMLTQSKQSVFLRFIGINPANSDKEVLVDLHSVSLSAEGELPMIGEEFSTLTLVGAAERNETGYPTAPVGRIYYHEDA